MAEKAAQIREMIAGWDDAYMLISADILVLELLY